MCGLEDEFERIANGTDNSEVAHRAVSSLVAELSTPKPWPIYATESSSQGRVDQPNPCRRFRMTLSASSIPPMWVSSPVSTYVTRPRHKASLVPSATRSNQKRTTKTWSPLELAKLNECKGSAELIGSSYRRNSHQSHDAIAESIHQHRRANTNALVEGRLPVTTEWPTSRGSVRYQSRQDHGGNPPDDAMPTKEGFERALRRASHRRHFGGSLRTRRRAAKPPRYLIYRRSSHGRHANLGLLEQNRT